VEAVPAVWIGVLSKKLQWSPAREQRGHVVNARSPAKLMEALLYKHFLLQLVYLDLHIFWSIHFVRTLG